MRRVEVDLEPAQAEVERPLGEVADRKLDGDGHEQRHEDRSRQHQVEDSGVAVILGPLKRRWRLFRVEFEQF